MFQNGAAPFQNGAVSKMGHNKYTIDIQQVDNRWIIGGQ